MWPPWPPPLEQAPDHTTERPLVTLSVIDVFVREGRRTGAADGHPDRRPDSS